MSSADKLNHKTHRTPSIPTFIEITTENLKEYKKKNAQRREQTLLIEPDMHLELIKSMKLE